MKVSFLLSSIGIGIPIGIGTMMVSIQNAFPVFFKNRKYGSGCTAISYVMFCVDTSIWDDHIDGGHYEAAKREIECSVEMDFKTCVGFVYRRQFLLYAKNRFLDKVNDFYDFDIADFKICEYINDLELFFDRYIESDLDRHLPIISL